MEANNTNGVNREQPAPAAPELKSPKEILSKYLDGCNCDVAYKSRELTDPSCAWCNTIDGAEMAMHEYLNQYRSQPSPAPQKDEMFSENRLQEVKQHPEKWAEYYFSVAETFQRRLNQQERQGVRIWEKVKTFYPPNHNYGLQSLEEIVIQLIDELASKNAPLSEQKGAEAVLNEFFVFITMAARETPKATLPAEMQPKLIAAIEAYASSK